MKDAPGKNDLFTRLDAVIESRIGLSAEKSYVASLTEVGEDAVLQKVIEEANELILAVKTANKEEIVNETADLWFHTMVLLVQHGLSSKAVIEELGRRFGTSGHAEKALRSFIESS